MITNRSNQIASNIALLLTIILLKTIQSYAQPPEFNYTNIGIEDGVPAGNCDLMLQDSSGFIWVTSKEGLFRYDGYEIKTYTHSTEANTLSSSECYSIILDKHQTMWVGTKNGLNRYNPITDDFTRYYLPQLKHGNSSLSNQFFHALLTDNNGNPVFIDEAGVVGTYKYSTDNIELLLNTAINYSVKSACFDHNNNLWAGTRNGLVKVNLKTKETAYFPLQNNNSPAEIWDIEKTDNTLWLSVLHTHKLYTFNLETERYYVYNKKTLHRSAIVFNITPTSDTTLWIATATGFMYLNTNKPHLQSYLINKTDSNTIENNINHIIIDNQNNIWLSRANGISFAPLHNNFRAFTINTHQVNTPVIALTTDTLGYYWSSGHGYNRLQKIHPKTGLVIKEYDISKFFGIIESNVHELFTHTNGNIYIGTYKNGLINFNPYTETFKYYPYVSGNKNGICGVDIRDIDEDSNGNLWLICHGHGFNKFTPTTGKFTNFNISDTEFKQMGEMWFFDLAIDTNDIIWLGHTHGLSSFNPESSKFKHYKHIATDTSSISSNSVAGGICVDAANNLWVGTEYGLNFFNQKTEKFMKFDTRHGILSNGIRLVTFDSDSNLWVGQTNGLSRLTFQNPLKPEYKELQIVNFKPNDGLKSYSFSPDTYTFDLSGNLLLGGNTSLIKFNPDNIKPNNSPPQLVFTKLFINNKEVITGKKNSSQHIITKNINFSNTIELNYRKNVFSIHYAGISFYQASDNQYAFILEGHDKVWNYVGNKREAEYRNVPPGSYTFRLKASNNDGVWNPEEKSMEINIRPPWWKTWWFRSIIYMVFATAIYMVFRIRIVILKSQKEKLQAEVNRQTENLIKQTKVLNELNTELEERQQHIEEQSEELHVQKEELSIRNTELIDKNNTLNELNNTKDTLFSIIAHDLRNPFSNIMGLSELLYKGFDQYNNDKRKLFISNIRESSSRVYRLLENLLMWARSQTQSIKFNPVEFNLYETIENNLKLYAEIILEKNIECINNIPKNTIIIADFDMIDAVIRNLLNNAIKYTANGNILITCNTAGEFIEISISDTGTGMTPEQLKTLFVVDKNKSTQGTNGEKGSGLGLIICREFVNLHNGIIQVQSEPDKGTKFNIKLSVNNLQNTVCQ